MAKAYLIYESWSNTADSSIVGVFLDEKKADEYIEEHGKLRKEENARYEKCYKCRCNNCANEDEEIFLLKDSCDKAIIKEDRHGLYCENDDSDFYETVSSDDFWKVEKDILG
jgi:hypothetical protein